MWCFSSIDDGFDMDGEGEEEEEEEEELDQAELQRRKERLEREQWLREQVCIAYGSVSNT